MRKRSFIKWLKIILIIYVAGGVALYLLQDAILFHPVTLKNNHQYNFPEPHKELRMAVNDKDTISLINFLSTDTVTKGVVLYFHGNKRNISWYNRFMPYFTKHGYEVMMIDYPGYGKSTGKLTEQKLYDWAYRVYQMALLRFTPQNIIIFGKSMGTGIATQLASNNECKQLILETPYYDFPSVISHYLPIYPVRMMLHYELPTYNYLPKVKAPITIFQGTDDWLVTYSNAIRLKPLLKQGDEFITVEGGSHNDLFQFRLVTEKLDSLLRL